MESNADVLIIGGGMVGAALACALGRQGFEVHVVEVQAPQAFAADQPLELRVSAVSLASQTLFEALDAWKHVLASRAAPFRRMRVWDLKGPGETNFDSRDIGEPVLGYIVENRLLQLALWKAAEGLDSLHWHCPARLASFAMQQAGILAQLDDGARIHARLVIGADGAGSHVRELANIGLTQWDYDVEALVATVRTVAPQQDITWQRFTPGGPQALLPLPGPHASLVWYAHPDEVARLKTLNEAAFLDELIRSFPPELGGIEALLERGSFRLTRRHAQTYVKPRLALAGDAAHTIHPLAGQGVNLGFMDVAALVETLVEARAHNEDIGALHVLRRYERKRRGENLLMQSAMDAFHHLFKPARGPLPLVRGLALRCANDIRPLRRMLIRRATGRAGDLARIVSTGRLK